MEEVKLYGVWGSPVSARVELALDLKGVNYEFIQQDLQNKSEELLKYNPIHKKIPVLLHNGKPLAESLVILEYIDEIWKENPLLPADPYRRGHDRFWAKFIDEKMLSATVKALLTPGDTQNAIDELHQHLSLLENEIIKRAKLFRESSISRIPRKQTINYLDIVGLFVMYWIPVFQEFAGKYVLTRENFPGIYNWADHITSYSVVKDKLPDKERMLTFLRLRFSNVHSNNASKGLVESRIA